MAVKQKAFFTITRHALLTIQVIHNYSKEEYGDKIADQYIATLYKTIMLAAASPDLGRKYRAAPFLMLPTGKHFIIYDKTKNGIVILAILHQSQHIEDIIQNMKARYISEIAAIREKHKQ
ncbi:MAG: type II toxin-antitoxin system RelE/ParE family toxin [Bdellovibrionales bacterium]